MPAPRLRPLIVMSIVATLAAGCSSHPSAPTQSTVIQLWVNTVNASSTTFLTAWHDYQQDACALGTQNAACATSLGLMNNSASTIQTALIGTVPSASVGYLGTPPPSIASLVADTAKQAQAVTSDIALVSTPTRFADDASALQIDLMQWQNVKA
jgi:hypothetical protein